ncbi:MAG TPA: hypothetical protein VFD05_00860 [Bacilli bacterium]|nr:hypothetical protein [Bacilli bacterium]
MTQNEIQLIFIVETTREVQSDEMYIRAILNYYYTLGENRISFIYLAGKNNYRTGKVRSKIEKLTRDYKKFTGGASFVIHVFDKDNAHKDYQDKQFVREVTAYAREREYHLIWFVRNIEEVLWGKEVKKSVKKKMAIKFLETAAIKRVTKKKLSAASNVNRIGLSNALTVLNNFPEIKKIAI